MIRVYYLTVLTMTVSPYIAAIAGTKAPLAPQMVKDLSTAPSTLMVKPLPTWSKNK